MVHLSGSQILVSWPGVLILTGHISQEIMRICLNTQYLWSFFLWDSFIGEPSVINSLGQRFCEWDWLASFPFFNFLTNDTWCSINTHSLQRCNWKILQEIRVYIRIIHVGRNRPYTKHEASSALPSLSPSKLNTKSLCKVMLFIAWPWFPPVLYLDLIFSSFYKWIVPSSPKYSQKAYMENWYSEWWLSFCNELKKKTTKQNTSTYMWCGEKGLELRVILEEGFSLTYKRSHFFVRQMNRNIITLSWNNSNPCTFSLL